MSIIKQKISLLPVNVIRFRRAHRVAKRAARVDLALDRLRAITDDLNLVRADMWSERLRFEGGR